MLVGVDSYVTLLKSKFNNQSHLCIDAGVTQSQCNCIQKDHDNSRGQRKDDGQGASKTALAHTLYKMKVRRARLLGLTLGI